MYKAVYFNRTSNAFVGIDGPLYLELSTSYPDVDVQEELNRMAEWLSRPGNKGTGSLKFIHAWLQKAQDATKPRQELTPTTVAHIDEYLQDFLWQKTSQLRAMNTRQSSTS
jgi:hypothetical protein